MIKKFISLFVILAVTANLAGCGTLRKKFVRKKPKKEAKPSYYQVREYDIKPSMELYTKHYTYWRSWQRELVEVLGENIKKDMRCIQEIIGNLEDMQKNLIPEKQAQLEAHIDEMREIESVLKQGKLGLASRNRVLSTLEKEGRAIKRNFTYRKMGPYIAPEFTYKEELEPLPEEEAVEDDDTSKE